MRKLFVALMLTAASTTAMAKDVKVPQPCPCQTQFDAMSEDVVAAIDYKALNPAEATGVTGFGVGLAMSYVPVDKDTWQVAGGTDISALGLAGIQVNKGLPLNIDVGAFYSAVPSTNVKLYGAELRYAILEGGVASPALAVRASYTKMTGVDNLDATTTGVDVSVSKGFAVLTPYAGVGYTEGKVTPGAATTLQEAKVNKSKLFAGLRLGFGLFDMVPEYSRVGSDNVYSLKLGFSI